MTTVMEVLKKAEKAVLVERHGAYFIGPLIARLVSEGVDPKEAELVALARNYAELEPRCFFALSGKGVETSKKQGRLLAEAGVEITEVIGSHQGRGPDTGLFICEGGHEVTGKWWPFRCHQAIDYPIYEYSEVLRALHKDGDFFVAQWLNGEGWSRLITSDTPRSFKGRVVGFIEDLLERGGRYILTTHFEILVLVHSLFVNKRDLGAVQESWIPTKNGGVIIWKESDSELKARDYSPDLALI